MKNVKKKFCGYYEIFLFKQGLRACIDTITYQNNNDIAHTYIYIIYNIIRRQAREQLFKPSRIAK